MSEEKLSERFRIWYAGGEKGMQTLCNNEKVPQVVKDAVANWYARGHSRFDYLVSELVKLESD